MLSFPFRRAPISREKRGRGEEVNGAREGKKEGYERKGEDVCGSMHYKNEIEASQVDKEQTEIDLENV